MVVSDIAWRRGRPTVCVYVDGRGGYFRRTLGTPYASPSGSDMPNAADTA